MKKHKTQKSWTKQDLESLEKLTRNGVSRAETASLLGRTTKAVEVKIAKLGLVSSLSADEQFWKKEAERLRQKVAESSHRQTATDKLVEKISSLAPVAYPAPSFKWPSPARKTAGNHPQSAVLVFSDTHIGQVVKPNQTLGLGEYNFELFLRRLARLERSMLSILQDHTTTKVPEIVVAMLGDMVHGNLQHAVEAGQVNTLFNQFYSAGHAIAQFFMRLSTFAPVRVHTAVGNHPRWGTQRKMPTDNRYSNLDQFLYAYVAALTKGSNVTIELTEQPFTLFDVQGFVFHGGHGDHLKGGDRVLGVPNHSIGRNISTTTQLFSRTKRALPNYYLVGHLHRPISLPHASGDFIVNGGFPGVDGYGLMEAFNPSYPLQRFFLVHPKFGQSADYKLRLDLGDNEPHHYQLPTSFCCQ